MKSRLIFAVLFLFAVARAQDRTQPSGLAEPTITFIEFDPMSGHFEQYKITVESSGKAKCFFYEFMSKHRTHPVLKFTMSPVNTDRVFAIARENNYFSGLESEPVPNDTDKTMVYADAARHNTYNYIESTNKQVWQLTRFFVHISLIIAQGSRLQSMRRSHDRGLNAELKRMQEDSQNGFLPELQIVAPILQNLAKDSSLPLIVRQRASHLVLAAQERRERQRPFTACNPSYPEAHAMKPIQSPADETGPLFDIENDGKHGYINQAGKMVIPPQYELGGDFSEGLSPENVGDKWGYIDKTGKMVIPPLYDRAGDFSEGLAEVEVDDKSGSIKWGYIDKTGKMVIPPQYYDTRPFSEGLAAVEISIDKWGYIDKTGKLVIASQDYGFCDYFSDGLDRVEIGEKYGYIDKAGKLIIAPQYDDTGDFSEGLAAVKVGEKWGYIDKTGKLVVTPQYDETGGFSEGLAAVDAGHKLGYIDTTGTIVLPLQYNEGPDFTAGSFSEGLAVVAVWNGKWSYIDKTGKVVIPLQYESAHGGAFHEGLARVAWGPMGDDWGYIDKTGKFVWKTSK